MDPVNDILQALHDLDFAPLPTTPHDSYTAARRDDAHHSTVVTLFTHAGWRVDVVCHDHEQDRDVWTYTAYHPAALPLTLALLHAATGTATVPTPAGDHRLPTGGWAPGRVELPGVGGPYPALLADMLTSEGWPIARFAEETVRQIAIDCDRLAARVGDTAGTTRVRPRATGGFDLVGRPSTPAVTITADDEGYYLLMGWCWQPVP